MNARIALSSVAALALAALALSGCSLAPAYQSPTLATPATWKPVEGWQPAAPADAAPKSNWWTAYGDPQLNDLVARAIAHNQTIAQAAAVYRQARATTRQARAGLFPTLSAAGQVTHSYSGGAGFVNSSGQISSGGQGSDNYRVDLSASWTPDLFGAQTNTLRASRYTEQARLADLANARLAIEGELVSDYLSLRATDAQLASLVATVDAYQRSLNIAGNRYAAGIAPRTDVFQAQSQLASAQSDLEGQKRVRAQYEDAIATLVGENAASFTLAALPRWQPVTPDVPVTIPSTLLQRRPDIASAERAVASANAQIGVQRAAFFPSVGLTGQGGFNASGLSGLFSAASSFWSLGSSVAETLLDFGGRSARVRQARAAYDAAVANYRQVTLGAFQGVQDNLVAQIVLARQEALLRTASEAADKSEIAIRNQYLAGQVIYTTVVTAQATALSARRALIQGELDRQNAAAALVQALGGGWTSDALTNAALANPAPADPASVDAAPTPIGTTPPPLAR